MMDTGVLLSRFNEEVYPASLPMWPQPLFKMQGEWEGVEDSVCTVYVCVYLCKRESERENEMQSYQADGGN